ncbi:MAG: type II secretion system protein [Candidatus Nomurabacteria bacterium]|nr:type II secretion system protein [Candidatus Nomurabacteria bacterium]
MFHKNKNNKGFTLIELLVVVAIISLLSSIVFASLNNARGKGRDARRIQDLLQIRNALALYAADHNGAYPYPATGNSISDMDVVYRDPGCQSAGSSKY